MADSMYELSIRATISADDLLRLVPSAIMNKLHQKKRKRREIVGIRQSRRTRKGGLIETQEKENSGHETEPEISQEIARKGRLKRKRRRTVGIRWSLRMHKEISSKAQQKGNRKCQVITTTRKGPVKCKTLNNFAKATMTME